ncbi:MAG: recombination protein RecR [Parcubacteria group bacterium Gr01-1014_31]|nr:MAG: recombination protein RecR [Parcubacteria group bacterium Gr01-1014_31]
MGYYPRPILELITQFSRLPGIGLKTAERLVVFLAGRTKTEVEQFGRAVQALAASLQTCGECGNFSEGSPCAICRNTSRDPQLLCVVAKPQDLLAIERTGQFTGRYHILGGTVDPIVGMTVEQLRFDALLRRIKRDQVREVILAFNPDVPGEGTSLTVKHLLQPLVKEGGLRVTKLARGLPLGSDVEYADEVTLSHALSNRREA